MNMSRLKSSLHGGLLLLLLSSSSFGQDEARRLDLSEVLFERGWYKNLKIALEKVAKEDEPEPVLIVYKKSAVAEDDERVVFLIPVIDKNIDPVDVGIKLIGFEIKIVNVHNNFSVFSHTAGGEQLKNIQETWELAANLLQKAKYQDGVAPDEKDGINEGNEYYVFSTFKNKDKTIFSGHMAGLIYNSKPKSKCEDFELKMEKLINLAK